MKNPSRKNSIDALVFAIQKDYSIIESLYNDSLHKKEIDNELKIKIKNYLENAKSIFDYCAHDIADVFGITADKIYFPFVEKNKGKISFEGFIGRNLPGLQEKSQVIFNTIEKVQPYNSGYEWLGDFADILNDSKHQDLTPQSKNESYKIKSEHIEGRSVSWDPNAVRFGSGVFINGAQINPLTQMPTQTQDTVITKEVWVDFKFNNSISVLPLLRKIKEETSKIIEDIYKLI